MKHLGTVMIALVQLIIMTPFFLLGFAFEVMACGFGAGKEASRNLARKIDRVRRERKASVTH